MTTTTHTPGPWLVLHTDGHEWTMPTIEYDEDAVDRLIAECERATDGNFTVHSFPLPVLLAAPDMLEALRRIADDGCSRCEADEEHQQNGEECDNHGIQLRAVARAAIAQAEGTGA